MGILSRFRDIMRANVNSFKDRAEEDPAKAMNDYMRGLRSNLGQVKAETASVLAEERRAKAALDECQAEIRKLQRYAEKAVEAGDEDKAISFLERKAQQADRLSGLQKVHELAAAKASSLRQLQEKLLSDIGQLEARHSELQEKLAASELQQGFSAGSAASASFDELEEKAYLAAEEAIALAELRSGERLDNTADPTVYMEQEAGEKLSVNSGTSSGTGSSGNSSTNDSMDPSTHSSTNDSKHIAANASPSVEEELAAIKARMSKKE